MKLTIDSDKIGYIRLPNGVILKTIAGIIDTTYTGIVGAITYYIPKDTVTNILDDGELYGNIIYNGVRQLAVNNCDGLTAIVAIKAGQVLSNNCTQLNSIVAGNAVDVLARNCALTAKSIGDVLYAAYIDDREAVNYDFRDGTNDIKSAVDAYLQATYSISYATIEALLVTTNLGNILIDTI